MVCVLVVGLGLVAGSSVRIQADTYATESPTYLGTCTGYALGNTQGSNIDSNVVSSDSASFTHPGTIIFVHETFTLSMVLHVAMLYNTGNGS